LISNTRSMSSQKLPTVQFIILLVSYYRAPLIAISTTTTRFILIIVFLVITFTYLKIRISCGAATKCCNKLTLQLNGFMHQISFIDRIKKKTLKYMPLFFKKNLSFNATCVSHHRFTKRRDSTVFSNLFFLSEPIFKMAEI